MSALYDKGREAFLLGDIDWVADSIKAVAVDTSDYTVDLSTDNFLSDVPAGAQIAISSNLSGKTATAGVADCDDITLTAVTGDTISAIVLYKDTGSGSSSILIAFIEVGPVTPNGTDIVFNIDNGPNRLFKL